MAVHRLGGLQDGPVAGAAAQVARHRLLGPQPPDASRRRGGAGLVVQREQRHHETGSAEAALRAVALEHGLLRRVQCAIGAGQVLYREHGAAVDGTEQPDAAVDRTQLQLPVVEFAQHHRAGAAVALGAAFPGAVLALLAQPVEQHGVGRRRLECDGLVAAHEAQRAGGQCHGRWRRSGGCQDGLTGGGSLHDRRRRGTEHMKSDMNTI